MGSLVVFVLLLPVGLGVAKPHDPDIRYAFYLVVYREAAGPEHDTTKEIC